MMQAAGRQTAHNMKPRMRKVQGTPNFSTISFVATPMTAAPRLPPPNTTPVASPRRRRNHCNGAVEQGCKCQLASIINEIQKPPKLAYQNCESSTNTKHDTMGDKQCPQMMCHPTRGKLSQAKKECSSNCCSSITKLSDRFPDEYAD